MRDVEDFSAFLWEAAAYHARNAVRFSRRTDERDEFEWLDAAFAAGAAVELMAKAYLVSKLPTMIFTGGKPSTIAAGALRSLGLPGLERETLKTITGHQAAGLVADLRPGATLPVDIALNVRNDAVHLAVVDRASFRDAVEQMKTYTTALHTELGIDTDTFWVDVANRMLSNELVLPRAREEAAHRRTMDAARARFVTLEAVVPLAMREQIAQQANAERAENAALTTMVRCPVCDSEVAVGITYNPHLAQAPRTRPLVPMDVDAQLLDFECPVCQLVLDVQGLAFEDIYYPYDGMQAALRQQLGG